MTFKTCLPDVNSLHYMMSHPKRKFVFRFSYVIESIEISKDICRDAWTVNSAECSTLFWTMNRLRCKAIRCSATLNNNTKYFSLVEWKEGAQVDYLLASNVVIMWLGISAKQIVLNPLWWKIKSSAMMPKFDITVRLNPKSWILKLNHEINTHSMCVCLVLMLILYAH